MYNIIIYSREKFYLYYKPSTVRSRLRQCRLRNCMMMIREDRRDRDSEREKENRRIVQSFVVQHMERHT